MAVWQRHWDLLHNAGSLVATTLITSALGFAYWALAARLFSQEAVGYASAAVSAMTLLGTVGVLGLGTVLLGELPRRQERGGLVAAAVLAAAAGSAVLGLGFAVVAPIVNARFDDITGTPGQVALFTVGVVLTAVTIVFDQATIAVMRGGKQLFRNAVFATVKLPALWGIAAVLHDDLGVGIAATWVVGLGASLLAVGALLRATGTAVLWRPDWQVFGALAKPHSHTAGLT